MQEAEHLIEAVSAVKAYGTARQAFRLAQVRLPKLLAGNDNKVGVCGEFWAKLFYMARGYEVGEALISNNEGYDFICSKGQQNCRVSVKAISDESRTGAQLPLKESQHWDELVLVLLDEAMLPRKFGLATRAQFEEAVARGKIKPAPTVRRSWLGQKGWMTKHATTYKPELDTTGISTLIQELE